MNKPKNTEEYIEASAEFARPILRHIRDLVHATVPGIEEQIKWQFPCFMYKGKILCHMAAFKSHCAFGFWLAPLMKDPAGVLEKRGDSSAMGQLGRITSLESLPDAAILKAYIIEAAALIDAGKTLPKKEAKDKPEIQIDPLFQAKLQEHPKLWEAFSNLRASHQYEYIHYINEAKREETKVRRIEKSLEMISKGLDLNSAYKN